MFLHNYWYVAAWSQDVTHKPIGRIYLDRPVVLYRGEDGQAVALEDRCAHRRMPLSEGKVIGDTLVCSYHGLTYDKTGQCVRVPGQATAHSGIKVRRYPTAERYGAVWIWMGDPELADPAKIFDCKYVATSRHTQQFYFHVKANYLYINDNLSDLLHQAYLHNPSFGGRTNQLGEYIPAIVDKPEGMDVTWSWSDVEVPGLFAELGHIEGRGDGWNRSTFQAPSFYINRVGFSAAGQGGYEGGGIQGTNKLSFIIHQLITPETSKSTHFFKLVSCDWPEELLPELTRCIVPVNLEDIWACEHQQRMEDLDPGAPMHTIPTDLPVAKMRHIIRELQREEAGA